MMKIDVTDVVTIFDVNNNKLTITIKWLVMDKELTIFNTESLAKNYETFVKMCDDVQSCLLYSSSENVSLKEFANIRLKHSQIAKMKYMWRDDEIKISTKINPLPANYVPGQSTLAIGAISQAINSMGGTNTMTIKHHDNIVFNIDDDGVINIRDIKIHGNINIITPWWKRFILKILQRF